MFKSMVTSLVAADATETNKKLIESVVVPQGVKYLVGVGTQVSAAGTTTLEDQTGILELESDDMAPWSGTQQFLMMAIGTCVTAANAYLQPYIHPTMIPVTPGARVKCSCTFNKAQTVNPSVRVQLVFE